MLGNIPLIKVVADEKKKTFISTECPLDEIDEVVEIFKIKNAILNCHCNSTYPLKDQDANLKCIETLRKDIIVILDTYHESSLLKVSLIAAALGATSIEGILH